MKIKQQQYRNQIWKEFKTSEGFNSTNAQLVLTFGAPEIIGEPTLIEDIRTQYPNAKLIFTCTSGEILNRKVYDNTAVITAIEFSKTQLYCCQTNIQQHQDSKEAGCFLIDKLNKKSLKAVLLFSDGKSVNGSELVEGLNQGNTHNAIITGGLAGDAARFEIPFVGLNKTPTAGNIVAIGLYGNNISVGHASLGGWDEFGHERTITHSNKNILYEIDGRSALDLYKEYLGPYKDQLPGSALLFPLSIKNNLTETKIVRTILSVDEEKKCMIFAGNIPEGSKVRLMKTNFDNIIQASTDAAHNAMNLTKNGKPDLAILVSCIGRKLILKDRIEEEVQAAYDVFGDNTMVTGFYSYGEISPFTTETKCELHNQTMTITTLKES